MQVNPLTIPKFKKNRGSLMQGAVQTKASATKKENFTGYGALASACFHLVFFAARCERVYGFMHKLAVGLFGTQFGPEKYPFVKKK